MPDWSAVGVLVPALAGLFMCVVIAVLAVTAAWTRHAGRRGGALRALALLLHRNDRAADPRSGGGRSGTTDGERPHG